MTDTSYPFEGAVRDQVHRLGGTVVDDRADLPLAGRVGLIQFPRPLLSESALDALLDQFAEDGVGGDDAVLAMRAGDDKWNQGLIWQAPGVAAPDPASSETARLPLLDLAAHYPDVLEDACSVCGADTREIVYLGFSESYPNYAFVRADDPNPKDPAVYTTDHELFFREIDPEGPLSEYLEQMLTDDVVYRALRDQLD